MFPDPHNQNGYPPAPPAPTPPANLQTGPNGQYNVVPPLPNGTATTGHNPYEFIMSSNNKTRKFTLSGVGGGSFAKRIAIFGGALVVVLIIVGVVMSALAPKGNVADLTAIAQRQQEIVRVSSEATSQISDSSTLNFVMNTNTVVATNQFQVVSYLQTHDKIKLKTKTLALDASTTTDTQLSNAAAANNYDATIVQVMTNQLQTYEGLLQTAYKHTTSTSGKQLLQQSFNNADALLKQAKALQGTSAT